MKVYKWYRGQLDHIFAPAFKIWSNAIPLKLDLYQSCTNFCRYCFAEELRKGSLGRNGIIPDRRVLRVLDVKAFGNFVNKSYEKKIKWPFMAWSLRKKKYIELGTTGETFQEADLETKIAENFFRMASDLEIPLLMNLKGNLLCRNEKYQKLIQDYKAPIIFSISFTTTDDKLGKKYEPMAPLPSERLKTFKELSKLPHVFCVAYISPFMPGVTNLDINKFVTDLVDNGIIGGHVRDFFIQGSTFQSNSWQEYMERNAEDLEPFPGGYHVTRKARLKFMIEATRIGVRQHPDYRLVGMKTKFFDIEANWGKMVYDVLDDKFKEGILDFSVIPLLRKIKQNIDKPQLLLWSKMGYKKDRIEIPPGIYSKEGGDNNLLTTTVCLNNCDLNFYMNGYEWIKKGLWNGFLVDPANGFISQMEGMFPVKQNGKFYMDGEDYVYAYIPQGQDDLVSGFGLLNLAVTKGTFKPYVDYDVAKNFMVTERPGGVEDKWMTKSELSEQTERLKEAEDEES